MIPRLLLCAGGLVAAVVAGPAQAEFYRWVDASGRTRVSNVPPAGVRADGSIAPRFNPNSIAAQHARMRERLAREESARRAAQDEDAGGAGSAAASALSVGDLRARLDAAAAPP